MTKAEKDKKKSSGLKKDPKTGRFVKGSIPIPGPGRPKADPVQKTAHRKALEMVEKMLGKCEKVIDEALSPTHKVIKADADGNPILDKDGCPIVESIGGDPRVAMWVIDRLIPKDDSSLPKAMELDIRTMQGVIDAGQKTVEWVASRQLTIDKGEKMLRFLLSFAQMRAFDRIDELKLLINEFEKQQNPGAISKMDQALVPQWGRLAEQPNGG